MQCQRKMTQPLHQLIPCSDVIRSQIITGVPALQFQRFGRFETSEDLCLSMVVVGSTVTTVVEVGGGGIEGGIDYGTDGNHHVHNLPDSVLSSRLSNTDSHRARHRYGLAFASTMIPSTLHCLSSSPPPPTPPEAVSRSSRR